MISVIGTLPVANRLVRLLTLESESLAPRQRVTTSRFVSLNEFDRFAQSFMWALGPHWVEAPFEVVVYTN